ncbi:hypothetical protein D3C81_1388950 [compost metagenome]
MVAAEYRPGPGGATGAMGARHGRTVAHRPASAVSGARVASSQARLRGDLFALGLCSSAWRICPALNGGSSRRTPVAS